MKGITPRTERIEFRLTDSQKFVIKTMAKKSGMSIADYILACVQSDINQYRNPEDYIDLLHKK